MLDDLSPKDLRRSFRSFDQIARGSASTVCRAYVNATIASIKIAIDEGRATDAMEAIARLEAALEQLELSVK